MNQLSEKICFMMLHGFIQCVSWKPPILPGLQQKKKECLKFHHLKGHRNKKKALRLATQHAFASPTSVPLRRVVQRMWGSALWGVLISGKCQGFLKNAKGFFFLKILFGVWKCEMPILSWLWMGGKSMSTETFWGSGNQMTQIPPWFFLKGTPPKKNKKPTMGSPEKSHIRPDRSEMQTMGGVVAPLQGGEDGLQNEKPTKSRCLAYRGIRFCWVDLGFSLFDSPFLCWFFGGKNDTEYQNDLPYEVGPGRHQL